MIRFLGLRRHDRFRTLLSSYIDGQVTDAESRQVEGHLSTCEECREELRMMRATVRLLRELPELAPSRSYTLERMPELAPAFGALVWSTGLATSLVGLLLVALVLGDVFGIISQTREGEVAAIAADAGLQRASAPPPPAARAFAAAPAPAAPVQASAQMAAPAPALAATPGPVAPPAPVQAPAQMAAPAPALAATPAPAPPTPALEAGAAIAEVAPARDVAVEGAQKLDLEKSARGTPEPQAPEPRSLAPGEATQSLSVTPRPTLGNQVQDEESDTSDAATGPSTQAAAREPQGASPMPEPERAVKLRLRQLEVAVALLFAALVSATVWVARRGLRRTRWMAD